MWEFLQAVLEPCFCNVTSCCGLSKVLMLGLSSCFSTCCLAFCSMLIGSVALTDTCFINISLALALRLSASIIFLYCSTAFQKIMFSWLNSFFKNSWEKKIDRSMGGYFYQHLLFTNYIEEEIKFEKSFQHSLYESIYFISSSMNLILQINRSLNIKAVADN